MLDIVPFINGTEAKVSIFVSRPDLFDSSTLAENFQELSAACRQWRVLEESPASERPSQQWGNHVRDMLGSSDFKETRKKYSFAIHTHDKPTKQPEAPYLGAKCVLSLPAPGN